MLYNPLVEIDIRRLFRQRYDIVQFWGHIRTKQENQDPETSMVKI